MFFKGAWYEAVKNTALASWNAGGLRRLKPMCGEDLRLLARSITSHGEDTLTTAGSRHRATHYVVKVELGGIAGVVAPLIGKQPQDTHVWILFSAGNLRHS